jgi:hypothetical protein
MLTSRPSIRRADLSDVEEIAVAHLQLGDVLEFFLQ